MNECFFGCITGKQKRFLTSHEFQMKNNRKKYDEANNYVCSSIPTEKIPSTNEILFEHMLYYINL